MEWLHLTLCWFGLHWWGPRVRREVTTRRGLEHRYEKTCVVCEVQHWRLDGECDR